ncbi:hypothetical protein RchiOBHm_Chr2g0085001 [Rosa chinensis]|uniref:Uncharacterized protein n=1 Tax=Rosa chinensis TaxID=74649 RepID=A0A2P6RI09_ROSCH|nr:hypothetical protein RchiOBHm_Chr2g0085001 [Rosa chinensis]
MLDAGLQVVGGLEQCECVVMYQSFVPIASQFFLPINLFNSIGQFQFVLFFCFQFKLVEFCWNFMLENRKMSFPRRQWLLAGNLV